MSKEPAVEKTTTIMIEIRLCRVLDQEEKDTLRVIIEEGMKETISSFIEEFPEIRPIYAAIAGFRSPVSPVLLRDRDFREAKKNHSITEFIPKLEFIQPGKEESGKREAKN